jgi:hypothetical protein
MMRTRTAALLVALLAGACDARGPSAPRPLGLRPAAGFTAGGDVEIVGESFDVLPVQRVESAHSDVEARYRAWIGTAELTDVVWVDTGTLRAHVLPGLPLGRHDLAVEGPFGRGVLPGAFEVIAGTPAAIAASLANLGPAAVGVEVDVAVTVTNLGDVPVAAVRPEIVASGTGALELLATAGPQDVPAGGARTFVSRYRATAAGEVALAVTVTGTDPRTGGAVSATATGILVVQSGAELSLTISIPGGPIALGAFPVTVTLTNVGAATALAVTVSPPAVTPASTAAAVLVTAPQIDAALASGQSTTFTFSYQAIASGVLQVQGAVSWTDGSGVVRTAAATSGSMRVAERAEVIAVDPLRDGSPFAFVAGYRGQLVLGPNRTGTSLARLQLDGTVIEPLALAFGRDQTGSNVASNTAPPYASIGFTGCTPNSATNACGPDDEDGRGLLASVSFGGDEWLLIGGARSAGELDYVYLSRASTSPLAFSYIDVGSLLGGATRGFTAAGMAGDRLYLGFADNGGSRPYGLALLTAPPAGLPGLDVVQGTDALELGLHSAYDAAYHAFTAISMIDAIAELNGRVYFFNNSGCLGAKTATPATSADFFACSPASGIDYDLTSAVSPPRQYDLEPRDRAWPQVTTWKGRLFAIHNTTTGPQLWCCDPARRGDPLLCDPSDWYLVAPDVAFRTQLGKATATAATLLVSTPTHLFVGFDDPVAGIHVFRTSVPAPTVESDFTGRDGCLAGTPGCEGLGGDGVGAPAVLTRIFDAKAIDTPEGGTDLYLTTGDGTGPVHVVRMSP